MCVLVRHRSMDWRRYDDNKRNLVQRYHLSVIPKFSVLSPSLFPISCLGDTLVKLFTQSDGKQGTSFPKHFVVGSQELGNTLKLIEQKKDALSKQSLWRAKFYLKNPYSLFFLFSHLWTFLDCFWYLLQINWHPFSNAQLIILMKFSTKQDSNYRLDGTVNKISLAAKYSLIWSFVFP